MQRVAGEGERGQLGTGVVTAGQTGKGAAELGGEFGDAVPPAPTLDQGGSCIGVVLTDIPLDARQLARVARRVGLSLARSGSVAHNGSGVGGHVVPGLPVDRVLELIARHQPTADQAVPSPK